MGQVLVTESYLQDIADAIRAKYGNSTKYTPSSMASAILSIPGGGATINNQAKSITPTESSQAITYDSGYTGLSTVTVGAIPSTFVGSGVTTKAAATITPTTSVQTAVNASVYTTGVIKVGAIATETKSATPTTSSQTISPSSGKYLTAVTVNPIPSCYVLPSGTKSINANGVSDVAEYKAVNVNVSGGGGDPGSLEIYDSMDIEADLIGTWGDVLALSGVGTLLSTFTPGQIDTNPVPSEIFVQIASTIPVKNSSNLTVSSSVVTAPAGYYESAATKAVAAGTEGTPTASKGTVSGNSITVTPSVTNSAGYITGGTKTGTGVSVSASELVSSTKSIASNGVSDVTNYKAVNVNVPGSSPGSLTIDDAVDVSSNDMEVDTTGGVLSFQGLGALGSTFSAGQITTNPTPSQLAITISSTIPVKTSSNLSASGSTITAPAGYYASAATKAISAGTEGTPTASKGTVSSNSISVTPSVTNSAGYISGGTKTGTAVSVSASQLVAGTASISSNGVTDVTNYKAVDVSVAGGGGVAAVAGTFKTQTTTGATQTITIPYTGSGYPIAAMVWIKGGAYNNGTGGNTTWYNSTQRYAVGVWTMSKARTNETPTYGTSGTANQAVTMAMYKNSTSNSTSYTRTSATTSNTYTSSSASSAALTCCRFKGNSKTLNIYVASSSYGLLANTEYEYIIYYSS